LNAQLGKLGLSLNLSSSKISFLLLISFIWMAPCDAYTVLGFSPDTIFTSSDTLFQIDVTIDSVENLYGTAFDINFDPQLLRPEYLLQASFLNENGNQQTIFQYSIHQDIGLIIIGLSRVNNDIPGVSSFIDTPLVHIVFTPTLAGNCDVSLSNISLYHPDGGTIPNIISVPAQIYIEPSSIREPSILPNNIMFTAYPNPFNTEIRFACSGGQNIREPLYLQIIDLLGNIVSSRIFAPGSQIQWDAQDQYRGIQMPSGLYFYKFSTKFAEVSHGKITLLK
jgi:hypothetical protein